MILFCSSIPVSCDSVCAFSAVRCEKGLRETKLHKFKSKKWFKYAKQGTYFNEQRRMTHPLLHSGCFLSCTSRRLLTWHLMPAWLQPQWRGSQYRRQSQPHSSRERRMVLSSAFSRASMRAMPEARRRARRRLVGRGWRKKQSSTSTPSTSRSSSDTSSRVSRSAWAHSTVPFLVSCGRQSVWADDNKRLVLYLKPEHMIIMLKTDASKIAPSVD